MTDDLEALASSLRTLHGRAAQAERNALRDRLAPEPIHRIGLSTGPAEPQTGAGPYEPALVLARRIVGRKEMSLAPRHMDIDIAYAGPGQPALVERYDNFDLAITTTITWLGSQVQSVVVEHDDGKTVTVTPVYTGTDITHIDREVT